MHEYAAVTIIHGHARRTDTAMTNPAEFFRNPSILCDPGELQVKPCSWKLSYYHFSGYVIRTGIP
jgi:hypothetical protein